MYERFSDVYRQEKVYQKAIEDGGEKLPEGQQRLGKKPSFGVWFKAMKYAAQKAQEEQKTAQSDPKTEVPDLEWTE